MRPTHETERFYEIDLLRFLAALVVVIFHYAFRGYAADDMTIMPYLSIAPVAKYGYLGVDLFFMISGFVILMTASSGSTRRFVISRMTRLYPAFWICCTVSFLVIIVAGGARFSATLSQYALNMTMLSGLFHVRSIDGSYWSLFVELKFYLLVFVALVMGKITRAKQLLGLWLVLLLLLDKWHVPYLGFFLITDYGPYFIAGAMFYLIYLKGLSPYSLSVIAVSYLLSLKLALGRAAAMEVHYHQHFDGAVIAVAISLFFVIFMLIATGQTQWLKKKKWLKLGALTYPLYLIHQNVGFIIFNALFPYLNPHIIMIGTVSAMLVVAYVVSNKFEKKAAETMKLFLERVLPIGDRSAASAPPPAETEAA